jgi:hypothetical protein
MCDTKENTVTFPNIVTQEILFINIKQFFTCNFICEISQRIMFQKLETFLV